MASVPSPVVTVQVRELVEFVLRRGDLGGERDFAGRDRAQEGTRGHLRVQKSRPAGYRKEVRVALDVPGDGFVLRVQGRIDGLLESGGSTVIEEIKTVPGSWRGKASPLHWAQVKVYGAIYASERSLACVTLRLVYLNLETERLTEFSEVFPAAGLATFLQETLALYLGWIAEQQAWRNQRDQSICSLNFPFSQYRPGQRDIAVASYRAMAHGKRLFIEAPTGIGKTVSVIFPALKALAEQKLERIFYLTARTTGRAIAENAFSELRRGGLRARSLSLTAKEKICVRDGQPCEVMLCPLAVGYYDRRLPALREVLASEEMTRTRVEEIGQRHQVCPFELSLDASEWADAVICDYNYAFDPQVYLRRHFAEDSGNYALLVDEAHNLVDRGRAMFSGQVDCRQLHELRNAFRQSVPACYRAVGKLISAIRTLGSATPSLQEPEANEDEPSLFDATSPALSAMPPAATLPETAAIHEREGVRVLRNAPTQLSRPVETVLEEAELWLLRNEATDFRNALLELYFTVFSFGRALERYSERFRTLLTPGRYPRVTLFCLDPSELLGRVLLKAKAAVLFSATLSPGSYYRELLGGKEEDPFLQLTSPFPVDRLGLLVHDRIRTVFASRVATLQDVAQAVGCFVRGRRGNYLVYLPSYQYLDGLQAAFQLTCPEVKTLVQRPGLSEAQRDEFLTAFRAENTVTQVGFAVLGGVFGEGVDLVGERLIGAVIVGVGLPQLCIERDLIRDYFQEHSRNGFDYAYTFPGMNRVLQAAGRVIRSEEDRGAVLLIDTRYSEARYRRLFPRHWRPVRIRHVPQLEEALRQFWSAEAV